MSHATASDQTHHTHAHTLTPTAPEVTWLKSQINAFGHRAQEGRQRQVLGTRRSQLVTHAGTPDGYRRTGVRGSCRTVSRGDSGAVGVFSSMPGGALLTSTAQGAEQPVVSGQKGTRAPRATVGQPRCPTPLQGAKTRQDV